MRNIKTRVVSLLVAVCMLVLLCPQFAFAAFGNHVFINETTGLVVMEGYVDYAEGAGEVYVVIPADGKLYSDFAAATTTEDLLSSVKYIGYAPVNTNGKYASSFVVEGVKKTDDVYIAYNGTVKNIATEETDTFERKLIIKDSVEYSESATTVDVLILSAGHTYEDYVNYGEEVVHIETKDVPVNEDGTFTLTISDASQIITSSVVVFKYNGEVNHRDLSASEFVVTIYVDSANGNDSNEGYSVTDAFRTIEKAEALYAKFAEDGYSGEIILCGGEYTTIPLGVAAPENGYLSYIGASNEETIISNSKKIPLSDFKRVSDADILARIDSNAAGYVYQVNLGKYGLNSKHFPTSGYEIEMPLAYLDGKPQTIARWPNSGYVDLNATLIGTAVNGETVESVYSFTNDEFGKWSFADCIYLEGFFNASRPWIREYAYIDNVNSAENSITILSPPYGGLGDSEQSGKLPCKVSVNNVLEAIDVPGEWYVDTNTMTMYYYMPEDVSDSDVLELAYTKTSVIGSAQKDISNVSFQNLTIRGSRGTAIAFNNVDNLEISNCIIENSGFGISLESSRNAVIKNNSIRYIKGNAVHIKSGGDPTTITPSGNLVENNHIYECATVGTHGANNYTVNIRLGKSQQQPVIINDVIKNNVVHASPYGEAILHLGMENDISYNEFYNLLHYVSDAGIIYNGNRLNMYGTNIHHNYMHDFEHTLRSETSNTISAIYWDDYQSGQTAEHNIIVGNNGANTRGLLEVGRDNTANYNLVVSAKHGIRFSDRNKDDFTTSDAYTGLKSVPQAILDRYPQIAATKKRIDEDPNNYFHTEGNKAWGNMHVDVETTSSASSALSGSQKSHTLDLKTSQLLDYSSRADSNGNIDDAYTQSGYGDIFVDHKNHDWRLKTSFIRGYSEHLAQNLLTESNFDMDYIGLGDDYSLDDDADLSFALAFPVNRTIESNGTVSLVWEKALYADNYTYEVSTDSAFSNIVASGTTIHTAVDVSGLKADTAYYWRVTAHNISKEMGRDWDSDSGVATFRLGTSDYKVKNIRFFDENDHEIKDMDNFASAKYATYDFVNTTSDEVEYDLIISLYDNSGAKLKQVLTYTKKCKATAGTNNYRVELEPPANYESGDLVYVFAWDANGSIDPVAKKNIIE